MPCMAWVYSFVYIYIFMYDYTPDLFVCKYYNNATTCMITMY